MVQFGLVVSENIVLMSCMLVHMPYFRNQQKYIIDETSQNMCQMSLRLKFKQILVSNKAVLANFRILQFEK